MPALYPTTAPLCPVTAVAFYRLDAQRLVLAGEGGWLGVYAADGRAAIRAGRCLGRLRVFAEQAMQGIRGEEGTEGKKDSDGDVLVWGGQAVALVTRAHIEAAVGGTEAAVAECLAPDWVYDGLLPRRTGSGLGALVTAHNEVVPFAVHEGRIVLAGPAVSPSRPMLYSAQLAWSADETGTGPDSPDSPDSLLVVAGTVFGEIVAWSCDLGSAPDAKSLAVLAVLAGHEGSIFDVAVSPPLVLDGTRARLLASCSDDRTVRVWPLYAGPGRSTDAVDVTPRTTGFQNTFAGLASRSDEPVVVVHGAAGAAGAATAKGTYRQTKAPTPAESTPPRATVMAHASRIWHVRFGALDAEAGTVGVFSFGEDACAQEWRLGLGVHDSELVHVRTLSLHVGKNIWAAAVAASDDGRVLVATGGSDGKICLFEGHQSQNRAEVVVASTVPVLGVELEPAAPTEGKKKPAKTREALFNSYAFLSEDRLLAVTNTGRVLTGDFSASLSGSSALHWTPLPGVPTAVVQSLAGYNVVRSPRGGGGGGAALVPGVAGLALVGNARGQLFLYTDASQQLVALETHLRGKVDDLFFLPTDPPTDQPTDGSFLHLAVVATTLFHDEAVLLDLVIDTAAGTLAAPVTTRALVLPRRTSTSPANTTASTITITAATRCGGRIVLGARTGQLCAYRPDGDTHILETLLQTRTRDAILALVPLPPRAGRPPSSCASIVATARDGMYRIYTVADAAIHLLHETATPFGPIVRDAWFVEGEAGPELVLCGFRSTRFVVWNETRQHELASVDCGGTHRVHTYLHTHNPERLRFAFTRNAELCLFAHTSAAVVPLRPGGHGREVRAVAASASGRFVATGAEDTVVRLWSADRQRCLSVLKLHNTGLHSLAWAGDDRLVSAAGAEELHVWRVATVPDSAYTGLAVLCEASYPDSSSDKVLRIIGLDVTEDRDTTLLISVGLSNSLVKTYRYTPPGTSASGWQLLCQGRYTGACPTHVRHLPTADGALALLAAFADGHLTVWRPDTHDTRVYALVCATKAHQNAVKALDTAPLAHESMAVFSGGDDNSIATTPLRWTAGVFAFGKTFRVASAHAAAVTGARVLESKPVVVDGVACTALAAVTCSNDQRVKAWRVLVGDTVRVQLLGNAYSAVADPGDVERIVGTDARLHAVVVGLGMESWTLEV